jgi:cytochrome c
MHAVMKMCDVRRVVWAIVWLGIAFPGAAQDTASLAIGKNVFERDCAGCHEIGPRARHSVGPHLNGLFGRRAAGLADFKYYSKALKESDIVWSQENFAAFIENPRDMILNTKQVFAGVKDKNEIAALIFYLSQFQD